MFELFDDALDLVGGAVKVVTGAMSGASVAAIALSLGVEEKEVREAIGLGYDTYEAIKEYLED